MWTGACGETYAEITPQREVQGTAVKIARQIEDNGERETKGLI